MTLEKEISKTVDLKFVFPDDLVSHFVNTCLVQHSEDSFILSFFEAWSPPILGTPEEKAAALEMFKTLEAKCVARVVLTPTEMRKFATVVQDNLNKFEKKKQP